MIVLGRIGAPYGVGGWVHVHPFGDDPQQWSGLPRWWLAADTDAPAWVAHELRGCKDHGRGLVAKFAGIDDREATRALKGLLVAVPREVLPPNRHDEYYWAELVGLSVVTLAGDGLGRVTELVTTGAHEVLKVRDAVGTERLLPFVAAVVKEVDVAGGAIRVDWQPDW